MAQEEDNNHGLGWMAVINLRFFDGSTDVIVMGPFGSEEEVREWLDRCFVTIIPPTDRFAHPYIQDVVCYTKRVPRSVLDPVEFTKQYLEGQNRRFEEPLRQWDVEEEEARRSVL